MFENGMNVQTFKRAPRFTDSPVMARADIERAISKLPDYEWQNRVIAKCVRAPHKLTRNQFRIIVWSVR